MKHLGDITRINGYEVPTVDIVVGGSPCQDLSVAGLRKGLQHSDLGDEETTRSGLFMEQIRLVKEMRENARRRLELGESDEPVRPRYMLWENVPGAFSSNKGEDFRCVLEEVARIIEEGVSIPGPKKWTTTGAILFDHGSIAWRVFDAQYWGVPQRRRRICLLADFDGHSAAEIVFGNAEHIGSTNEDSGNTSVGNLGKKRRSEVQPITKGMSGNPESCEQERQEASKDASGSSGTGYIPFTMQVRCGCDGGGKGALIQEDKCACLSTSNIQTLFQPVCVAAHGFGNYEHMDAVGSLMCGQNTTVRGDTPLVISLDRETFNAGSEFARTPGIREDGINSTLVSRGPGAVVYNETIALEGNGQRPSHKGDGYAVTDKMYTLNTAEQHGVAYGFYPQMKAEGIAWTEEKATSLVIGTNPGFQNGVCTFETYQKCTGPLMANSHPGGYSGQDAYNDMFVVGVDTYNQAITDDKAMSIRATSSDHDHIPCVIDYGVRYIVRRLTPLECERLQGFPDGWTDIGDWVDSKGKTRKAADSQRYKALGNSIALPSWKYILKRVSAQYERDATMASLFDGIGGFPYLWEQINGKGSCLWASEIEDFPIRVTEEKFNESTVR